MQDHIAEGREVLNFSVWDAYVNTKAAGECGETIQEGEMPPGYYAFMHQHGDLSTTEKQRLVTWFATNVPGGEGGGGKGEEENEDRAGCEERNARTIMRDPSFLTRPPTLSAMPSNPFPFPGLTDAEVIAGRARSTWWS